MFTLEFTVFLVEWKLYLFVKKRNLLFYQVYIFTTTYNVVFTKEVLILRLNFTLLFRLERLNIHKTLSRGNERKLRIENDEN